MRCTCWEEGAYVASSQLPGSAAFWSPPLLTGVAVAMVSRRTEVFVARLVELGLEDLIGAMKAKGFTSYDTFAFGTEYHPQMAYSSLLTTQLLKPIAGQQE